MGYIQTAIALSFLDVGYKYVHTAVVERVHIIGCVFPAGCDDPYRTVVVLCELLYEFVAEACLQAVRSSHVVAEIDCAYQFLSCKPVVLAVCSAKRPYAFAKRCHADDQHGDEKVPGSSDSFLCKYHYLLVWAPRIPPPLIPCDRLPPELLPPPAAPPPDTPVVLLLLFELLNTQNGHLIPNLIALCGAM